MQLIANGNFHSLVYSFLSLKCSCCMCKVHTFELDHWLIMNDVLIIDELNNSTVHFLFEMIDVHTACAK